MEDQIPNPNVKGKTNKMMGCMKTVAVQPGGKAFGDVQKNPNGKIFNE